MKSQRSYPKAFSFEFFPPKTPQGVDKLREVSNGFAALKPCFFSVTFGAGGSTRDNTFNTVIDLKSRTGVDVAPHLSCIGSTRENIRDILNAYREQGIRHIVALRGDMPSGMRDAGEFRYANELVEFIRQETGNHFFVEVAAYPEFHPQAPSAAADLENFRRKVEAGADAALTQYFYNPDSYFRFVDSCEKLGIRCLRRRNSALDPPAAGVLWGRYGRAESLRTGCNAGAVSHAARTRCAGAALLYDESARAQSAAVEGSGPAGPQGTHRAPGLRAGAATPTAGPVSAYQKGTS
jgi:hypothetical protein